MIATEQQNQLITLATQGLGSPASRRAYTTSVADYLRWWNAAGKPPLSKASVLAWRQDLEGRGLSSATISQRMSVLRKLAMESADAGIITHAEAMAIGRAKSPKITGTRTGNWLTMDQAQELLDAPDQSTVKGLRDSAIIALLLGAGLRRAEITRLEYKQVRALAGRWVLADIRGKGNRVRTVPIANWVVDRLRSYWMAAGITDGLAIRAVDRFGTPIDAPLGPQGIYSMVAKYAEHTSLKEVAPHDLRRTFAQQCYRHGSDPKQIQHSLGHGSLLTTERYLGAHQDLTYAPGDSLPLR